MLSSRQIFRYAVPARTVTKKHCVQYCTVYESMWRSGALLRTPLESLQRPPESRPPVKHTILHNRHGVLKCSKTHLQQTKILKIFRGTNPRTTATGSALEHKEQARQLSNAGPVSNHSNKQYTVYVA